ncbi:MAG TPA: aminoglycoside phosphotransferase family protein [Ktedonobacterales bacterium]
MLTPPALSAETITGCLSDTYGLRTCQVNFLPLGADINAVVYRIDTEGGTPYFLKLRRGDFDEMGVAVPSFLHARGIQQVMAPLMTTTSHLWTRQHGYVWILYPFFEGLNGYRSALSEAQWIRFGQSMQAIHSTVLPLELASRVPHEDYSPQWRESVLAFDQQIEAGAYDDQIAQRLAAFWISKRNDIRAMVGRAGELARALRQRPSALTLCHADLHPGNVLVGADDALTIVDWDNPIFAPKERDLMCLGGGVCAVWSEDREAALFYQGYGPVEIDPVALSYYRYERIVADVAAYGDQIFGVQGSVEDREEGLEQLMGQFLPGEVVDVAHQTYRQLS